MASQSIFNPDSPHQLIDWALIEEVNEGTLNDDPTYGNSQEEIADFTAIVNEAQTYIAELRNKLYNNSDVTENELIEMFAKIEQLPAKVHHNNDGYADVNAISEITTQYTSIPANEIIDIHFATNYSDIFPRDDIHEQAFKNVHGMTGAEISHIMLTNYAKKLDKHITESKLQEEFEREQKEARTLNDLKEKYKKNKFKLSKPPKAF